VDALNSGSSEREVIYTNIIKFDKSKSESYRNIKNSQVYKRELAYTNNENVDEGDFMPSNEDYLIKLIEKVEQSNQQLKIDVVESEKRISEERRESERRITEERRLSEERMEKRFIQAMDSLEKTNDKIDSLHDKLDKKIETKIGDLEEKIDSTNKWIMGVCISTIVGIAAIAASIVFAIFTMMPKK
jgi:hypothetical protein